MELEIKEGSVTVKHKTLEQQIEEKKGLTEQAPIQPPGYTKRKYHKAGNQTEADLKYEADLEEWEKGEPERREKWLKTYYADRYEEMNALWEKYQWKISKSTFFDKYDAIVRDMNKGVISKRSFMDHVYWRFMQPDLAKVEFIHTPEADEFVDLLFHYFVQESDTNYNLHENKLFIRELDFGDHGKVKFAVHRDKGLGIVGGVGIGKTKIMRSFVWALNNRNLKVLNDKGIEYEVGDYNAKFIRPWYKSGNDVEQIFNLKDRNTPEGWKAYEDYELLITRQDLVMDDILAENRSFGRESVSTVFQIRYDKGLRTHMIVNYPKDEPTIEATLDKIAERYDFRVDDRQFEMFNFVALTEKSKRITKYI